MNYDVKFTDTAKADLREIAYRIADKSGDKSVAKRFITELRERCRVLETFPDSGAFPKDRMLLSAGYRYLVHKNYLIIYSFEEEKRLVYILAVFHEKQDYVGVMKKFI
jgi:plasmid stabilization system protein ParE